MISFNNPYNGRHVRRYIFPIFVIGYFYICCWKYQWIHLQYLEIYKVKSPNLQLPPQEQQQQGDDDDNNSSDSSTTTTTRIYNNNSTNSSKTSTSNNSTTMNQTIDQNNNRTIINSNDRIATTKTTTTSSMISSTTTTSSNNNTKKRGIFSFLGNLGGERRQNTRTSTLKTNHNQNNIYNNIGTGFQNRLYNNNNDRTIPTTPQASFQMYVQQIATDVEKLYKLHYSTTTSANNRPNASSSPTMRNNDNNNDNDMQRLLLLFYIFATVEAGIGNHKLASQYYYHTLKKKKDNNNSSSSSSLFSYNDNTNNNIVLPISGYRLCLRSILPRIHKPSTSTAGRITYMMKGIENTTSTTNTINAKQQHCPKELLFLGQDQDKKSNNNKNVECIYIPTIRSPYYFVRASIDVCASQYLYCGIGSTFLCGLLGISVKTIVYVELQEYTTWPLFLQEDDEFVFYTIVTTTTNVNTKKTKTNTNTTFIKKQQQRQRQLHTTGILNDSINNRNSSSSNNSNNDKKETQLNDNKIIVLNNHRHLFDKYTIQMTHPLLMNQIFGVPIVFEKIDDDGANDDDDDSHNSIRRNDTITNNKETTSHSKGKRFINTTSTSSSTMYSNDTGFIVYIYSDNTLCNQTRTSPFRYGNMGDTFGSYFGDYITKHVLLNHNNMSYYVKCFMDGVPPPKAKQYPPVQPIVNTRSFFDKATSTTTRTATATTTTNGPEVVSTTIEPPPPPESFHLTFGFIGSLAGTILRNTNPHSKNNTSSTGTTSHGQLSYKNIVLGMGIISEVGAGVPYYFSSSSSQQSSLLSSPTSTNIVLGVRGPLTRDIFLYRLGINPQIVYDPGLYFYQIFRNDIETIRSHALLSSSSTTKEVEVEQQQPLQSSIIINNTVLWSNNSTISTSLTTSTTTTTTTTTTTVPTADEEATTTAPTNTVTMKELCFISHEVEHDEFVQYFPLYTNNTTTNNTDIATAYIRAGKRGHGGDIYDIIQFISTCETIISSSLHGIIFAHSLSIPAMPIRVTNKLAGGDFKFIDYYYSINVTTFLGRYNLTTSILQQMQTTNDWIQLVHTFVQPTFPIDISNARIMEIVQSIYYGTTTTTTTATVSTSSPSAAAADDDDDGSLQ